jgi:hypothetical protein
MVMERLEEKREITPKLDFKEIYKINIANSDPSFSKHEIVKLLIVKMLMFKNRMKLRHNLIYTEYDVGGKVCDIYHYNDLTKETICYEIQKQVTPEWLKNTKEFYESINADWILIDLNELSDDIFSLELDLKELIV